MLKSVPETFVSSIAFTPVVKPTVTTRFLPNPLAPIAPVSVSPTLYPDPVLLTVICVITPPDTVAIPVAPVPFPVMALKVIA